MYCDCILPRSDKPECTLLTNWFVLSSLPSIFPPAPPFFPPFAKWTNGPSGRARNRPAAENCRASCILWLRGYLSGKLKATMCCYPIYIRLIGSESSAGRVEKEERASIQASHIFVWLRLVRWGSVIPFRSG